MLKVNSNYNLENWLALSHTPGIGPIKFMRYLEQYPNLDTLPSIANPDRKLLKQDLDWLRENRDAYIITYNDPKYPKRLQQIYNPPPVLYVLGNPELLNQPQIAVVGGRKPTQFGIEVAASFAQRLAESGLVITSGLANGIDSAGHNGALRVGSTIAVAAYGLQTVYPASNQGLARKILKSGCFVSEYPIGTKPLAARFIQRNRIISGLSLGVLVVDAAIPSGSLSTAAYAREQNREVFAVPGAINNNKTRGCHMLIKQGAKLVESVDDVLEELANLLNCDIRDKNSSQGTINELARCLSKGQKKLLDCIDMETVCTDDLLARTRLKRDELSAALVQLELNGLIKSVPGGYMKNIG